MPNAWTPAPDEHAGRQGDRLESWKVIARYLERDIRTVQRWERQEGMPVHRHRHDQQASVYAFRNELDDWQRSRALSLRARENGELDAPTAAVPVPLDVAAR